MTDLFAAARERARRKLADARKRHAKTRPHQAELQRLTHAALRFEMGARHG